MVNLHAYPQSPGGEYLFAGDGVNNSEIPLDANDDQNENTSRVAQWLYKQVHFAEEFTQNPAENNEILSWKPWNIII